MITPLPTVHPHPPAHHPASITIGPGDSNNAWPLANWYVGNQYQQVYWPSAMPTMPVNITALGLRSLGWATTNLPANPYWDLTVKMSNLDGFFSAGFADNPGSFTAFDGRIYPNIVGDGSVDFIIPISTFTYNPGSALFIDILNRGTNTDWTAFAANEDWGIGARSYTTNFSQVGDMDGVTLQFTMHTSPVPEPATYAMMGLGLAALGLISRRKKA